MFELALRLVFSLAVVVGLLALLTKFGARRFGGRKDSMVQVLHRQHLSRGTAVSVVTVGSRVLVLGTTEHQVRVLAELDPDEVAEHLPEAVEGELLTLVPTADDQPAQAIALPAGRPAGSHRATPAKGGRRVATQDSALNGSVLSVDTWRQALAAATGKAS
jgi:flagellar protein FliO/FliZ